MLYKFVEYLNLKERKSATVLCLKNCSGLKFMPKHGDFKIYLASCVLIFDMQEIF